MFFNFSVQLPILREDLATVKLEPEAVRFRQISANNDSSEIRYLILILISSIRFYELGYLLNGILKAQFNSTVQKCQIPTVLNLGT